MIGIAEKVGLPCVSVIIPTYNRAGMLSKTIQSFLAQNFPHDCFEIIIVDNNSSDNTKEIVEQYALESPVPIRYLFEARQGVHYARNTAINVAKFDCLYYTDDDMIADKNMLKEIVFPFQIDTQVGAATGTVLPIWEVSPPHWVLKHCQNSWLSLFRPPANLMITQKKQDLYSCHELVRKEALIKAGGFHPENTKGIWIGDGETGTNMTIEELGYKFGYNDKSITYHIIPQYRMTQNYLNQRIGNDGRCNAFTDNRRDPHLIGMIKRFVKRHLYRFPILMITYFAKMLLKLDINYLRIMIAYLFYFNNRNIGDLNFLFDKSYRKMVLRSEFLTME